MHSEELQLRPKDNIQLRISSDKKSGSINPIPLEIDDNDVSKNHQLKIKLRENYQLRMEAEPEHIFRLGNSIPIPTLVDDYNKLINKPSINHNVLVGDINFFDLFPEFLIIDGEDAGGVINGPS